MILLQEDFRTISKRSRRIVSKALDMSMPNISMATLCLSHFAESHLCAQTMSDVDLPGRKPLCVWERKPID